MLTIDGKNIGHGTLTLMSPDTDRFYEAKPSWYFGLSQEAAGVHAALKGAGLKDMLDKEGRTWMILRTRMTVGKLASWMDEVEIETWCQEGYRLYCPRCVRATDRKTGELLFSSENHWVIMDVKRGRPERPSYIDDRLCYADPAWRHFDPAFPRFPSPESFTGDVLPPWSPVLSYYDSDYNRHVNNISYINWTLQAFGEEWLDSMRPVFFDTEWKKECHSGDRIRVLTQRKDGSSDTFLTRIMRETDEGEEEVFHCVSEWRERGDQ